MMKQKLRTKWYMPQRGIHLVFAEICLSKTFEAIIYFVIICNVVVLAMPYHGMSNKYYETLEDIGFAFTIIYNMEALIKLIGLRKRFFHEYWNIMDLVIVISSDVGLILDQYTKVQITVMMPVIRALRVARILKLVRGSAGLKVLIEAISSLFFNTLNILGLMMLLIFIFAILGTNMFHNIMFKQHYNEYANFRSFDNSLLLLLRCVTGEGWNLIMVDLAEDAYQGVQCIPQQTFDDWAVEGIMGCGSRFSHVFFFTFVVLSQMVLINLFIAFVLQAYLTSYHENHSLVTLQDYSKLIKLWADYDPKARGLIDP